ncbi:MAG: hypothetical protein BAJALOKI3v1_570013 [Promethearchaeota archaeon]|nr:MAG: hypothetical protein BAJALOKI3v1_570013 [Candidatus Lokiarchaeota archaeon]
MTLEKMIQSDIESLREEIDQKNQRIYNLLDKIEDLEEHLVLLEKSIKNQDENPDNPLLTLKNIKLEEHEKEIRRLKNNMGFLRKENLELKRKLRDDTEGSSSKYPGATLIRIEEKKKTLQEMIEEVQQSLTKKYTSMKNLEEKLSRIKEKIQKKDKIINVLKEENDFLETLIKEKDSKIKDLKESVINLELMYSKLLKTDKNMDTDEQHKEDED